MNNEENQQLELFQNLLKEIFTAFPYLNSIKITKVGKELVEDRKASCPEFDMMHVSAIDLDITNKKFSDLSSIDQNKLKSKMMENSFFKEREAKGLNSEDNYEAKYAEFIKKDLSLSNINKLVVIAAIDANIIKTNFLNKATEDYSASHEFVFTSNNLKEAILNKEFITHIVKDVELGSEEFRKALLSKPKLF